MQAISLERSGFAQTAVVSLATFAALALLGLVLAYWTWAWFAPRSEPPAQAAEQTGGRGVGSTAGLTQAASGLFGRAQRDGAAPTGIAVRLLGVMAASGGRSGNRSGYAVLRLDAKQVIAVREGGEIEPGVRLAEVHADHVVLERSGVRETLAWPERSAPAGAAAPAANK
jgi:general secretion pathway protein C